MKKIALLNTVLLASSVLFAQHSLEKIWETDSLTLTKPESVLFDPASNSLYVSNMGAGTIVRFGLDGKLIKNDWVTGLTANKGAALHKGLLYTAETSSVAVIDVDKAAVIKHIPIEGAQFLNDLVIDAKGVVYVTDTRAAKVYKIEGDKPTVYLDNMPDANGLLLVNKDLYVLTATSVNKVSDTRQVTKIADGFEAGLDGIVMVAENEFVISNWHGLLYYLTADGSKQVLSDTRSKGISDNDISYDSKTRTVYVAALRTNRVIAYKIK